jgi:hypothetical protein
MIWNLGFPCLTDVLPHLVVSYNTQGDVEDLSSWVSRHIMMVTILIDIMIAIKIHVFRPFKNAVFPATSFSILGSVGQYFL